MQDFNGGTSKIIRPVAELAGVSPGTRVVSASSAAPVKSVAAPTTLARLPLEDFMKSVGLGRVRQFPDRDQTEPARTVGDIPRDVDLRSGEREDSYGSGRGPGAFNDARATVLKTSTRVMFRRGISSREYDSR